MGINTYVTKPVSITAIQYTEDLENIRLIDSWTEGKVRVIDGDLICETLNGKVRVDIGDYIIYNKSDDEFYPCKPEVFNRKYRLYKKETVIKNTLTD